jgi:urease accessory protein
VRPARPSRPVRPPPIVLGTLLGLLGPTTALAHTGEDVAGGLLAGLLHPISGLDHVLAMVAVGLWGAQLGSSALWLLPVTFPVVMAMGGALGIAGAPMPAVEVGIAVSAIALGAMVAAAARPRLAVAAALVGVFAIFHGYTHGEELPSAVAPLAYSVGFVVATGCLHVTGIVLGTLVRWPAGAALVRASGIAIGLAGLVFLARAVGLPG